ncbi:MAG: DUF2851 family protein, partial [Verrucomicrobiota bacterium]
MPIHVRPHIPHLEETWFPRSRLYRGDDEGNRRTVRESRTGGKAWFPWPERHVQCLWFDAALRPTTLLTEAGEPVRVEAPGRWNLEAGPDFLDAVLYIGEEERRMTGDVEVHIHPSGWVHHGHA